MATTTNFGWETPDDTDLVKDGALAMRTLGNAIDASLVDLKGGTTGQVLSKTSNTDMDFTWVTSDDANAIQNAIVDAKGDLIAASAADTPARLAVGNNGETLVADSSASTGLRWQGNFAAGKNKIINGDFDIWQRGTSGTANSTAAASGYNADRWQNYSANALTVSRQATGDTTNLPFIQYCARIQRNAGQTATTQVYTVHTIETANSIPLAGKTVTLSFYARAGANFSATSNVLTSAILYGTGTDQNIFAFTNQTTVVSQNNTLTSTWQRFSVSVAMPSTATQIGLNIYYTPTGTASTNDYFELTGVQLEAGNVATAFQTATGTLAGELAACRYYYRRWTAGTAFGTLSMFGTGISSTQAVCAVPIDSMRVYPTSVGYANINAGDGTNSYAVTALTLNQGNPNAVWLLATVASGLTQYRPTSLVGGNNTAGYIELSAEL